MPCDTKQHQTDCGIDLPARTMDVCLLHQAGKMLVHQPMPAWPAPLLRTIAPYREEVVVAVACLFTWYWLADRWAQEGMPCILGQALSMPALHGGNAQNDTIAAQHSAVLLCGGLRPQAAVAPAERRATRELLRRRMPRRRTRAEWLPPLQPPQSQDTVPEMGQKSADKAHRAGVAERWAAPAGQQSRAGDRALLDHDDRLRRERALPILKTRRDAAPGTALCEARYPAVLLGAGWRRLLPSGHVAPTPRRARATAPRGPRAATRSSHGPSPKRPCSASERILPDPNIAAGGSKHPARAQR